MARLKDSTSHAAPREIFSIDAVVTRPTLGSSNQVFSSFVKPDQEAMDLLEQLRRLVAERNLAALDEISAMSEDRRRILESLFANYSTIEASLGEIVSTPTASTSGAIT